MKITICIPFLFHLYTGIISYGIIFNRFHINYLTYALLSAYSYDILYTFITQSNYFYRWTTSGLYKHHFPFLFLYTYSYLCVPSCSTTRYFEVAAALGGTSSLNECIQILGTLINDQNNYYIRLSSTLYGLLYFCILANLSLVYGTISTYYSWRNNKLFKYHVSFISILCSSYGMYFYPTFGYGYYKRLKSIVFNS